MKSDWESHAAYLMDNIKFIYNIILRTSRFLITTDRSHCALPDAFHKRNYEGFKMHNRLLFNTALLVLK